MRRLHSWIFCALVLCGVWMAIDSEAAEGKKRKAPPNIVWILGDDHAAYALGCYGSPVAKTPNLDALAKGGARFTRAYCNSPVCTASRQSFLTGRLPHATGVTLLNTALSPDETSLAEFLKQSGYRTAAIGKMHFNSAQKHGFDVRLDIPQANQFAKQHPGKPIPPNVKTLGPWKPMADPAEVWLNADVRPMALHDEQMDATFFAKNAIQFIQQSKDQPFFLMVSFTQPHSPFHFPVEFAGKYEAEKMPVPQLFPEDPPQIPLIFRHLTAMQKKGIAASYYTAVEYLDTKVGAVLDALEDPELKENTVVIYCGDHGYSLGHHGRFEKHSFYEQAIRTPLLIRWPGKIRPGKEVTSLVELVDIFPTLAEIAGMWAPRNIHGKSLMPVLTGKILGQEHREYLVSQYHENEEAMIRTEQFKLIYCSGKRARLDGYKTDNPTPGRYKKLYDLRNDPEETTNIVNDPQYAERVEKMEALLLKRLESTANPDLRPPASLSVEDKLDWYLVPPESRSKG